MKGLKGLKVEELKDYSFNSGLYFLYLETKTKNRTSLFTKLDLFFVLFPKMVFGFYFIE